MRDDLPDRFTFEPPFDLLLSVLHLLSGGPGATPSVSSSFPRESRECSVRICQPPCDTVRNCFFLSFLKRFSPKSLLTKSSNNLRQRDEVNSVLLRLDQVLDRKKAAECRTADFSFPSLPPLPSDIGKSCLCRACPRARRPRSFSDDFCARFSFK